MSNQEMIIPRNAPEVFPFKVTPVSEALGDSWFTNGALDCAASIAKLGQDRWVIFVNIGEPIAAAKKRLRKMRYFVAYQTQDDLEGWKWIVSAFCNAYIKDLPDITDEQKQEWSLTYGKVIGHERLP